MNKIVLGIVSVAAIAVLVIIFGAGGTGGGGATAQKVEVRDGVQYVTVRAGGGYSPRVTTAAAGIPTKLLMETTGVFDCSMALKVEAAGFQKILPATGITEIDLGTREPGEKVNGVCSMGMYSFAINFE